MIIMYFKGLKLQFQQFLYIKMSKTTVKIVTVCDKSWWNLRNISIRSFSLIIEFSVGKVRLYHQMKPLLFLERQRQLIYS